MKGIFATMINAMPNPTFSAGLSKIKNVLNFEYLCQSNHARLNLICKFMLFMKNGIMKGAVPLN